MVWKVITVIPSRSFNLCQSLTEVIACVQYVEELQLHQNSRKPSWCPLLPILVLLKAVYTRTLLQGAEHLWSSVFSDLWIDKTSRFSEWPALCVPCGTFKIFLIACVDNYYASPSGRAVWGMGLRPLVCWVPATGNGCLSVVSVVCVR